ncbi:hypothetical protein CYY_004529 [Polysphondylium violaceum]|uniref:COMM domain-containing protein n=1 Tax=Polysphondylium violaceum TaxID=133409 RepID=A0A8J4V0A5_9MYCE|nr:hypothetical protein CYY_004529 [Polysphondylium violaceum]
MVVYKFLGNSNNTGESSDQQQVINEVGYLSKLSDEALVQLIEILFEFLIVQKAEVLMNNISNYSSQHSINENTLSNIFRSTLYVIKGCIKNNVTPSHLKEDLISMKLGDEQAEIISSRYKLNFIGLSRSFVGNSLSVNQVLDMQWRFGVTTATSENTSSKQQSSTFLQLKLVLDKGDNIKEDVHMELTLPQFYQFLKEMEKAKSSLEYFN